MKNEEAPTETTPSEHCSDKRCDNGTLRVLDCDGMVDDRPCPHPSHGAAPDDEDRSDPPPGYRAFGEGQSGLGPYWWEAVDTKLRSTVATKEEAVAACWAHRDAVLASVAPTTEADWKGRYRRAQETSERRGVWLDEWREWAGKHASRPHPLGMKGDTDRVHREAIDAALTSAAPPRRIAVGGTEPPPTPPDGYLDSIEEDECYDDLARWRAFACAWGFVRRRCSDMREDFDRFLRAALAPAEPPPVQPEGEPPEGWVDCAPAMEVPFVRACARKEGPQCSAVLDVEGISWDGDAPLPADVARWLLSAPPVQEGPAMRHGSTVGPIPEVIDDLLHLILIGSRWATATIDLCGEIYELCLRPKPKESEMPEHERKPGETRAEATPPEPTLLGMLGPATAVYTTKATPPESVEGAVPGERLLLSMWRARADAFRKHGDEARALATEACLLELRNRRSFCARKATPPEVREGPADEPSDENEEAADEAAEVLIAWSAANEGRPPELIYEDAPEPEDSADDGEAALAIREDIETVLQYAREYGQGVRDALARLTHGEAEVPQGVGLWAFELDGPGQVAAWYDKGGGEQAKVFIDTESMEVVVVSREPAWPPGDVVNRLRNMMSVFDELGFRHEATPPGEPEVAL